MWSGRYRQAIPHVTAHTSENGGQCNAARKGPRPALGCKETAQVMSETGKGPMNDLIANLGRRLASQPTEMQAATDVEKWVFCGRKVLGRYNLLIDALPSMVSVLNTSNTDAVGKLLSILHSPEVAGAYRPHGPPP